MEIIKVSNQEARKIIDTREPIGLFYIQDLEFYIGIDNLYGHANVEEFITEEECFKWLNRETGPIDEKEVYMAALIKWGAGAQITMVFEEMAELQKELCKHLRDVENTETIKSIAEEMADVEIMLEQMKELFDIEKIVGHFKEQKLERLAEHTKDIKVRVCRKCGYKDYRACDGGCYWVEEDLCNKCVEPTFIDRPLSTVLGGKQ